MYLKINSHVEASAIPRKAWELVAPRTDNPGSLLTAYQILKPFEGYWIMADAIICQLQECKPFPKFSLIHWPNNGGSWMWFPIGKWIGLYLPRSDHHE